MPSAYMSEKFSHVWMREVFLFLQGKQERPEVLVEKYSFSYFSNYALDPLFLTELGLTPFWNLACGLGVNIKDPGIEAQHLLPLAFILHPSIPQPQMQPPPTHVPLLEAEGQLRPTEQRHEKRWVGSKMRQVGCHEAGCSGCSLRLVAPCHLQTRNVYGC